MNTPPIPADLPFRTKLKKRWLPREMREAPELLELPGPARPVRFRALLINPFYPKDPHASFGKHVLTPTLALTSVAAATPPEWTVEYWDENLLHGPPPCRPVPEVVGITVHLTFARRACELADYYRRQGARRTACAVVSGGIAASRGCAGHRRRRAALAGDSQGHRCRDPSGRVPGNV